MSVPAATVTGKYLGDVFTDEKCQKIFAHVALEAFKVAEADGCPKAEFSGKSAEHWQAVADGRISGLPSPDELIPGFPPEEVDAYTKDIRLGLDLEIGYTNGAIVRIGKQHGIPTPVNELLIQKVYDIAAGKATPGYALADEIIAAAK
jgi:ketopantoate reductase